MESVKCGSGILKLEKFQNIVNGIDSGVAFAHGSYESDVLEVAKAFSDFISLICDVGGASVVSGVWSETAGMFIKSLIAREEINQAADDGVKVFEIETNKILSNLSKTQLDIGASLLNARIGSYLKIIPVYHVDDSYAKDGEVVGKSVTSITPVSAVMGQSTNFTITGQNLPLTSVLSIADATCQTPTNRTATGFTVVCTLGGAAGSKVVTVKTDTDANGGGVIDASRSISVSGNGTYPATAKLNVNNGHYYELITCGAWSTCRDAAIARGGRLVTIRSKSENDWLSQNLLAGAVGSSGAWIGLTDESVEGEWRWVSGEPVSYLNWNTGEPNGSRMENYGHIYTKIFVWNDLAINNSMIVQAIVEYY